MMTLTLLQGHTLTLKSLKNSGLLPISQALFMVLSPNFYHGVADGKAITGAYDMMTLTLIQGHSSNNNKKYWTPCNKDTVRGRVVSPGPVESMY